MWLCSDCSFRLWYSEGSTKGFHRAGCEPFAAELISRQYVKACHWEGELCSFTLQAALRLLQGQLLEARLIREKVMTNKRIHVSAIVLLIAAIIIDVNNNGLCPGHAPAAWVPT